MTISSCKYNMIVLMQLGNFSPYDIGCCGSRAGGIPGYLPFRACGGHIVHMGPSNLPGGGCTLCCAPRDAEAKASGWTVCTPSPICFIAVPPVPNCVENSR